MSGCVILVGGPDSGKTNYIGRLWPALESAKGDLYTAEQPNDISFIQEVTDHLYSGHFAPRSEHSEERRDFKIMVAHKPSNMRASIVVPDISGELWQNAVAECEIKSDWMKELREADGALLFLRIGSELEVKPLDWVTSQKMLTRLGSNEESKIPTQVMLCELIRFLEVSLATRPDGSRPRLSVVVGAWDLVDADKFAAGPSAYLDHEYPLVAGRLCDTDRLNVRVFGLSIVGGDLKADPGYREKVLETGLDGLGWVAVESPEQTWQKSPDLTLPVAWAIGAIE
ncbi:hypothetical protein [Dyella sp.]|uniref:TRAFAC clade GTPase domain-containing protein n=1 Tax=Dyella sp. TaxID=1869338 RepID=UPI003F7FCA70